MKDRPRPDDASAFMLVVVPITGKIYRIWPRTGQVLRYEWGEKRWWQELSVEQFARETQMRVITSLLKATVIHLPSAEAPAPEADLLTEIHGPDEVDGEDEE